MAAERIGQVMGVRAVELTGREGLRVVDLPKPVPGPRDVLVR